MNPSYKQIDLNSRPEERREYWETAFGLQAVDDLEPSKYLRELSEEHIAGKKSYYQLSEELDGYYEEKKSAAGYGLEQEADLVSRAIFEILADGAFAFDVLTLKNYHKRLFSGLPGKIFHPGEFRTVNITKKEAILDGDTVLYQDFGLIQESLEYDFKEEGGQDYGGMSEDERIKRYAEFASRVWQVHPFMEGNTRTTAVFLEKYLRSLGFSVNNEMFEKHAKYFRDALVRANYNNLPKGIAKTDEFLIKFLENLLLERGNKLDASELHV